MARLGFALLVALLVAAAAWLPAPACGGAADLGGLASLVRRGGGAVGECAVDEEEEMGLGGGEAVLRRSLAARRPPAKRYISYAALKGNQVPCDKRGRSYYTNCASQQPANPYHRGCSAITRCARNLN